MEYNFAEIGERIRLERKRRQMSQDDFLEQLGIPFSRNRLSRLENGEQDAFSLQFLLAASTVFDCDVGYILGEYGDCRTRDNQFIHDCTGLTEENILLLARLNDENRETWWMDVLNQILDNKRFLVLLQNATYYAGDNGEVAELINSSYIKNPNMSDVFLMNCQSELSRILESIKTSQSEKIDTRWCYQFIRNLLNEEKISREEYASMKDSFDSGDFSLMT